MIIFNKRNTNTLNMNPFCFVITSFDKKPNLKDLQAKFLSKNLNEPIQKIDFDRIYEDLVLPAIKLVEM